MISSLTTRLPRKIVDAGGHELRADAQRILWRHITDTTGEGHKIDTPVFVVPGLTGNISSVTQALKRRVWASVEPETCNVHKGDVILPLN